MIKSKLGGKPLVTASQSSNILPESQNKPQPPKKRKAASGHTRPEVPPFSLDVPARVRVKHWLALLSVSHSTFYEGMKTGRYPKPDGYDGKFPYWRTSTAREFLES
jgi:predicted DNA-binding transcriptional regulator AlpA